MRTDLKPQDITPELRQAVAVYLDAVAKARVIREKVDAVQRTILTEMVLIDGTERERGRITDPKRTWMCRDDEVLHRYYAEVDSRLRAAGLKPDEMETDYCPALVAEDVQRKAEWAIFDTASTMLEMELSGQELNSGLLCMKKGLEKRQEFIDLTVGLVLSAS